MNYFLTSDVVCLLDKKKLYGKRGDKVKVISDCSTVFIVENEEGNRFSCEAAKLSGVHVPGEDNEAFLNKVPAKKQRHSKPVQLNPTLF